MYIFEFFKRLTNKSSIPIFIYLILNVLIIGSMMSLFFELEALPGLGIGLVVYIISLVIALSPIGEWILRIVTGCKKIKRKEYSDFIEPLFKEVYDKAKRLDPSIPDDVKLYIVSDKCPNAFATGRKTIGVTEGMLKMPEEQIKATLGHEFGHLAHKDTDIILVVTIGNMLISAGILFIRIVLTFFYVICCVVSIFIGGTEGAFAKMIYSFHHLMIMIVVSGLTWLWTKIGMLLCMASSRSHEYEADEFSFKLGYGKSLCELLDNICGSSSNSGLFANLASSHPNKDYRIAKLQELGADYRK